MATVGRSDLLGSDETERLTRLQWETAGRLRAALASTTALYPTHGAGSFCSSAGADAGHFGPLADEVARNPVFTSDGYEAFRAVQLAGLPPIPGYYRYMAPINRAGPEVFGSPPQPRRLTPAEVVALQREQAEVIDVRPRESFAASHIPRSVLIEGDGSFLAYVGWLIPFNSRIVLITSDVAQAERLTVDLFRIGYENVEGYQLWSDWDDEDRPAEALVTTSVSGARATLLAGDMPVYDVRFQHEQEAMPVAGTQRRPVDQLPGWLGSADERPVLLFCASGQRAAMVASFLQRAGHQSVVLDRGGAAALGA